MASSAAALLHRACMSCHKRAGYRLCSRLWKYVLDMAKSEHRDIRADGLLPGACIDREPPTRQLDVRCGRRYICLS